MGDDKKRRRSFTEEFKRDSVRLVVVEGYTIGGAARAIGVDPKSMREWVAKYGPDPEACGEDATVQELIAENKRLRNQLREAALEREILKKATAYFAKESQ